MNIQSMINLLLLALLVLGITTALIKGDVLWAICFGAAFLQRFSRKPTKRRTLK